MNILTFAKKAGLSTATISRAFHEPDKLRPETRDRVLTLASQLGYYPSPSGRALVRGRHDVLGLIWPLEVEGAEALFAQRILTLLTRHLVENDLDLLICPVDRHQPSTVAHAHRTLQRSRCDAWILLYPRPHDSLIEPLKDSHKPVVSFMGRTPDHPDWKCVKLDQKNWIADSLKRLKASGSKSVLFFGGREGEPDHEDRLDAFRKLAPRQFGTHFADLVGWPPDSEMFLHLIKQKKIDAIIGADDRAALLALSLCQEANMLIPKKVRIVGIDNTPETELSQPPLSTYQQPLDEMVRYAVELALGRHQDSGVFQATFVPRVSLSA
jgi:DNA-binding LacI/PurR family transcriptional regulator